MFCKYAKNHISTLRSSTQPPACNDYFFFCFLTFPQRITYFRDAETFSYIICLLCFHWANIRESFSAYTTITRLYMRRRVQWVYIREEQGLYICDAFGFPTCVGSKILKINVLRVYIYDRVEYLRAFAHYMWRYYVYMWINILHLKMLLDIKWTLDTH